MNYKEYINSEKWKARKALFLKFNKKDYCYICGSVENLNVHHKRYRNLGKEKDNDLMVLCEDCHHRVHFVNGKKVQLRPNAMNYSVKLLKENKHNLSVDRRSIKKINSVHSKVPRKYRQRKRKVLVGWLELIKKNKELN